MFSLSALFNRHHKAAHTLCLPLLDSRMFQLKQILLLRVSYLPRIPVKLGFMKFLFQYILIISDMNPKIVVVMRFHFELKMAPYGLFTHLTWC